MTDQFWDFQTNYYIYRYIHDHPQNDETADLS